MTSVNKRRVGILAALGCAAILWVVFNPPSRFGWCRFGVTTYNSVPRPITDLQIRADGAVRTVGKTHDLTMDRIEWLLAPKPDVLIIGIGWDGKTVPRPEVVEMKSYSVQILKTGEAIKLFNELKGNGKRVAIHIHSTC